MQTRSDLYNGWSFANGLTYAEVFAKDFDFMENFAQAGARARADSVACADSFGGKLVLKEGPLGES